AAKHGLVKPDRLARIREKKRRIEKWTQALNEMRTPSGTWGERIRRREENLALPDEFQRESDEVQQEVLYRVGYQGYLNRELNQISKMSSLEDLRLPPDIDYL